VADKFKKLSTPKTGSNYAIDPISIILVRIIPRPTPARVLAVNYETLLPEISPILFCLANLIFRDALEAADSKKQMFLAIFASDAKAKNIPGY